MNEARRLELRVANMDCENEAAQIERGLRARPGILELRTFPKSGKLAITFDGGLTTTEALEKALGELGFPVQRDTGEQPAPAWYRAPKVLASLASGVLAAIAWGLSRADLEVAAFACAIVAMIVGGYFFAREALEKLFLRRRVGIELLMSTAAIGSAALGEPLEGAMLVFLYSISEAAEGFTEAKTRSAVRSLMKLAPKIARVRRDGVEREVPVEELAVGEVFIVRPGESIATDGVILAGASSVNQAPVTGESEPVPKGVGDTVFSATINADGVLEVEATKTYADNTLARIVHMVEEAQESKGKSQRFIERFGAIYSPLVLFSGVAIAVAAPLATAGSWTYWAARAVVVIVAAAPCALVISVPITMVAALGTAARNGVLVKGGLVLEELARVGTILLDKTGTLTRGEPVATEVVHLSDELTETEALAIAAAIEGRSEHPVARAIVRLVEERGITPTHVEDIVAVPGAGIRARVGGRDVFVGRPELFTEHLNVPLGAAQDVTDRVRASGKTIVLVGDAKGVWLVIGAEDAIRDEAQHAVDALHAAGQSLEMLSGDHQAAATRVAERLGIDRARGDLRPEHKLAAVRAIVKSGRHVAMVGDGVNDAPALAEASVGVAMGAAGTDVALETADIALMGDDLRRLAFAIALARKTRAVVRQNLVLSTVIVAVLTAGAALGVLTLPVAVIVHELSELVVIASGLRLLVSPKPWQPSASRGAR